MNDKGEIIAECFTVTTDQDAANHFSGEVDDAGPAVPASAFIPPGEYRMMEGRLFTVLSDLPLAEVRARLLQP